MSLSQAEWTARRRRHETRVDDWTGARLARRTRGDTHPVDDFLFDYYATRPARLRVWHPGAGVELLGPAAEKFLSRRGYRRNGNGVALDATAFQSRVAAVRWIHDLAVDTLRRPPSFGCLGMHEWAMVYRLDRSGTRHSAWPLRLSTGEIAATVEASGLRCTHYDAYRFFTPSASPMNLLPLTRVTQRDHEQPGCLHANMDLYKWAGRLSPLTSSELVADAFELARELRTLDMRASPYDLSALGYTPVRVETAEGKLEYVATQRALAERSVPLRRRLVEECDHLLANRRQPAALGSR
jgi:hypothetical protein